LTSDRPSDATAPLPPHGLEYFYAPPNAFSGGMVRIDGDEFAHLSHVMRRQPGDIIGISDGAGTSYVAEITALEKRMAVCAVCGTYPRLRESAVRVVLAAALLKNPSRYDYLVEKATEVGVSAILPIITERTIPRQARVDRWQKLALAAMKQSGRCILPLVHEPVALATLLAARTTYADACWMFHEAAEGDTAAPEGLSHLLLIGPEGGFTDAEVGLGHEHGCAAIRLGPRRLRSETAAVAAAARFLL
jgi:16S rRNA (uracil1498-N3)-methyltransferase